MIMTQRAMIFLRQVIPFTYRWGGEFLAGFQAGN